MSEPTNEQVETLPARRVTPINEPIDRGNVGAIQISDKAGGISFANMIELMDFAKLVAVSGVAVPKHLRGNPGACLAICMQAVEWQISPFALANRSYSVNDRLAYEAAVFQAVLSKRAPIKGRIKMAYSGKADTRVCKVWATLSDGTGDVEYESPEFGRILPKNSPLWKNDPDQQLFYFSVRAFARRHFADVMMGIVTSDEMQDAPEQVQTESTTDQVRRLSAQKLADNLKARETPQERTPEATAAKSPTEDATEAQDAGESMPGAADAVSQVDPEEQAKLEYDMWFAAMAEIAGDDKDRLTRIGKGITKMLLAKGFVGAAWKVPASDRKIALAAAKEQSGHFRAPVV